MTKDDLRKWHSEAFSYVQGMLLQCIWAGAYEYMSEERVRLSMLNGLVVARPSEAHRARVEDPVPWTDSPCACGAKVKQGRKRSFDLGVAADSGTGLLAACEVKWLKTPQAQAVAQDIWKLVLTQDALGPKTAMSAFLLLGGEQDAVRRTFDQLKLGGKATLKWSAAGRQKGLPGGWPIDLKRAEATTGPWRDALEQVLGRGSGAKRHYRTPPACWDSTAVIIRETWCMTAGKRHWRLVLWEFAHDGRVAPVGGGTIPAAGSGPLLTCPTTQAASGASVAAPTSP